MDLYPSISEELLAEALSFASNYDTVIIQVKKSLLFNGNTTWCKMNSKSLFDVTMGTFAETCELVGSYLLSKITPEYGNDIGLYRDDGLAALEKTARDIEQIMKHICKVFNDHAQSSNYY